MAKKKEMSCSAAMKAKGMKHEKNEKKQKDSKKK
jgi:hypothetical protein